MKLVSKTLELAGRTLTLEVGRFAARATSAVFARYGDTTLLATVVLGKEDLKKIIFLCLSNTRNVYMPGAASKVPVGSNVKVVLPTPKFYRLGLSTAPSARFFPKKP